MWIIKENQKTKDFFVSVLMVDQAEPTEEVHCGRKKEKHEQHRHLLVLKCGP